MTDVIIIGSGPAGLTAAIYARRAGFSVLVIEKAPMSGGQIINTHEVDNYPGLPGISGFDMGLKFREHAESMGAEFTEGEVIGLRCCENRKEVITEEQVYPARTVIIAAGAEHAELGVKGEAEFVGKGVSYCAVCDGAFYRNKTAAVVGGGDAALEDAIFLAEICEKVYLIHRRDKLRGAQILQEKIFSLSNVEILWDTTVEEISGLQQVEKISLINKLTGLKEELQVDGVFVAIGMRPMSEKFVPLIQSDENGYLVADENCNTNIKGIFAAGDIRTKRLRQVVTAVADGANAVAGVQDYFLSNTKTHKN